MGQKTCGPRHCGWEKENTRKIPGFPPAVFEKGHCILAEPKTGLEKIALFRLKPMACLTPVFKNLFFSRRRIKFEFKIQKLEDFLFLAAAGSWSWLSLCKEMCKNRQITGPPFSRWGITGRCRHHLFCEKRNKNLQKKVSNLHLWSLQKSSDATVSIWSCYSRVSIFSRKWKIWLDKKTYKLKSRSQGCFASCGSQLFQGSGNARILTWATRLHSATISMAYYLVSGISCY